MKSILFVFLLCFTDITFGASNIESLVISGSYAEVKNILNEKKEKSWKDYFYLSTSNHHLGFKNQAYLYGIKSLILNPFSGNNLKNLNVFYADHSSDEIDKLLNVSLMKLSLSVLSIIMISLSFIFFRKKKLLIFLCSSQIITACFFLLFSYLSPHSDLGNIATQLNTENILVKVSPVEESGRADGFSTRDILFVGKAIGEWRYVENINGDAGWVNNVDLVF